MVRSSLLLVLALMACGKTLDEVIEAHRPTLSAQRTRVEAAAKLATSSLTKGCVVPPDLVLGKTVEIAYLDSIDWLDADPERDDHLTVKLDPHQSNLLMALRWASPKRVHQRPPFPYSLLPSSKALPSSIQTIEAAERIRYLVLTRVTERFDEQGTIKGEAVLVSLEGPKALCVLTAQGHADPGNEGRAVRLVRVEKKSGKEVGELWKRTRGDYEDLVTSALADSMKSEIKREFGLDWN